MNPRVIGALLLGWYATADAVFAESGLSARVGQSGEYVELEHRVNGQVIKDHLPLYQAGGVRYFSAGVGVEERNAEYPPFPLKLVFTAGGKPYLSGVEVTITPAKGGAVIAIPREQVEGPWLFVDLPAGIYDVSAMQGDRMQGLKGIKIEPGRQKSVLLRWPEERGAGFKAPKE